MAPSPTDLSAALQSIPEKKELLRKAFGDLEEQRAIIARCSGGWNVLDAHLTEIQEVLEKRYAQIVEKEKNFDAKMAELQAALDKRESVIESREQASLARVQEQKEAAVAAILEQKRKWIEERQLLQSQSPAKPDPDTKTKQKVEAVSKGKVNTTPDTCTKERADACAKGKTKESNPKEGSGSNAKKTKEKLTKSDEVSAEASAEIAKEEKDEMPENTSGEQDEDVGKEGNSDAEDQAQGMEVEDEDGVKTDDEDGDDTKNEEEVSLKKEASSKPSLKARPELKSLCENMDGPGLCTFVTSQKKDINLLRKELPLALKCASNPSKLVLSALEGYHSSTEGTENKKLANRRSCVTLLESLAVVLADGEKDGTAISSDAKEEAKKVAESWKSKLNPKATDQSSLLDAQSFLQLLATYGLAQEYNEDELCDIVAPICKRKKIPAVWRKLGLADKVPEIVDRLIKDGKQVDAVYFVQEFELSEQFPPVPLLKAYLKEIRQGPTKPSPEHKDEFHAKELNAARAVLKCVEKYKLEADYPTDGLQRRIVQLERVIPEKKRNSDSAMSGSKKPRTNGPNSALRQHFGGRGTGGHSYGSPYPRGGRGGYSYPAGGLGYGASPYSHGSYQYGGGPPSYQGSYLR